MIPNIEIKNIRKGDNHIFDTSILFDTINGVLEFHSFISRESIFL